VSPMSQAYLGARGNRWLVGGTGASVLLGGFVTGAVRHGLAGAGTGAGVGLLAGFLVAGLVRSTGDTLTERILDRAGLAWLTFGIALSTLALLATGAVVGARVDGGVGAAVGAVIGLTAGLDLAMLIGYFADTVVDLATVGRGLTRLAGMMLGALTGAAVGLPRGGNDVVLGGILGLIASGILLEIVSTLRSRLSR
jgi:hypothetical protein